MASTVNERIGLLVDHFAGGIKSAFARNIGISQQGLHNLLSGRQGEPSFKLLSGILQSYPSVSANWLMMGQGPMLNDNQFAPTPATAAEPQTTLAGVTVATQQQELAHLREQLAAMGRQVDFLLRRVAELS